MDWLAFSGLVLSGFVACCEFGAFLMVCPIVRRLADTECVETQRKLLHRRETILAIPSALIPIILVGDALRFTQDSWANRTVWGAIFCFSAALAVTFWWYSPITKSIDAWNSRLLPTDWKLVQARWHAAQAARGVLQFAGFILFCLSVSSRI
jgi:Domain of unknown function (DUF1772)